MIVKNAILANATMAGFGCRDRVVGGIQGWLFRRRGLHATFSQASASKLFLRVAERTCQCFQATGAQAYGGSSKPHRHAHDRMGHPAVIALFAFA